MRAPSAVLLAGVCLFVLTPSAPATTERPRDPAPTALWAHVLRPVTAREAPGFPARPVSRVQPATPEGETNLLLVLRTTSDSAQRTWVRVRLAILPNAATGWVPQDALGAFHTVRTQLVIDRSTFRAVLWRGGRVVFRATVGVGKRRWPTPRGEFYVREKLAGFGDPFYGPVAFGTSARSPILTDWPGGGYVGIHGTDRPELIPGRISHGCIRMRNADIRRLARLMPLGTPMTIV
jgi:lipoprotein-anchoring transpeptidase ErfK/SrfK